MAKKSHSPWGTVYKEGLPSTAVNDQVFIDQTVTGTITTGVIDSITGQWKGITVTDDNFNIDATHEAVPNSGVVLSPQVTPDYIDMTGYSDLLIGIYVTNSGDFGIDAVMGPNSNYYANLTPVDPATNLRFANNGSVAGDGFDKVLADSSEGLTANVWNILSIQGRARGQKLLQFKITNSSGAESDIQFAYLRVV